MKQLLATLVVFGTIGLDPVQAGGRVTVTMPDGPGSEMAVSWRDDKIRLDPAERPAYLLMREGKVYSVSTGGRRTVVMDLSAMGDRLRGGGPTMAMAAMQTVREVMSMEATGRRETVAGITGEVHTLSWKGPDGKTHRDAAVLTRNEVLVAMAAAMKAFADRVAALGGNAEPDVLGERLVAEGLGLLRFGDRYRVLEVSETAPAPDAFELPAKPLPVPDRR